MVIKKLLLTALATLSALTLSAANVTLQCSINASDPFNPTAAEDAENPPGPTLSIGTEVKLVYTVVNNGPNPVEILYIIDDNGTPSDGADDVYISPPLVPGVPLGPLGGKLTFTRTMIVQEGQYEGTTLAKVKEGAAEAVPLSDTTCFFGGETAADLIDLLYAKISLISKETLKIKQSLLSKLDLAAAALAIGDEATACAAMQDFINQLNAQVKKQKVSAEVADPLLELAFDIQDAIGC